jgi:hypothetical protein
MEYFETRIAGEQPKQYKDRIDRMLQGLEDLGAKWTEEPALRGAYLFAVPRAANSTPFAYIEYPK